MIHNFLHADVDAVDPVSFLLLLLVVLLLLSWQYTPLNAFYFEWNEVLFMFPISIRENLGKLLPSVCCMHVFITFGQSQRRAPQRDMHF